MPTTVLIVCTGNLCRSPIIEHLWREKLGDDGDLVIRSAGTLAWAGDPIHPHSLTVLAERGIDAGSFQTTPLDEAALADVDVVVGAAREHRAAAVSLRPALLNRAFTLAELSRICADVNADELPDAPTGERMLELARLAASRRTSTLPMNPADDDLVDPIGRPVEEFVACAATVDALLAPIVGLLEH